MEPEIISFRLHSFYTPLLVAHHMYIIIDTLYEYICECLLYRLFFSNEICRFFRFYRVSFLSSSIGCLTLLPLMFFSLMSQRKMCENNWMSSIYFTIWTFHWIPIDSSCFKCQILRLLTRTTATTWKSFFLFQKRMLHTCYTSLSTTNNRYLVFSEWFSCESFVFYQLHVIVWALARDEKVSVVFGHRSGCPSSSFVSFLSASSIVVLNFKIVKFFLHRCINVSVFCIWLTPLWQFHFWGQQRNDK